MKRRELLKLGGMFAATTIPAGRLIAAPVSQAMPAFSSSAARKPTATEEHAPADYAIRIAHGTVELSRDVVVSTTLYNGTFPGPLLRVTAGQRVVVDVENHSGHAEELAWHGLFLPDDVDGAAEERTPYIQPRGKRRLVFRARPGGLYFYHSLVYAGNNLERGLYSGLAGPVFIEAANNPGRYDREVFLTLKEFEPYFTRASAAATPSHQGGSEQILQDLAANTAPATATSPLQLGYRSFAVNGRMLGSGVPIRVRRGDHVMFHIINASATELRRLALPGHRFKVVALDGHAVPTAAEAPVLWLAPGERISALVNMDRPGVWQLADIDPFSRQHGMGIVIEYAGSSGKAAWQAPPEYHWDYRNFADPKREAAEPDETINLLMTAHAGVFDGGFTRWLVNGKAYDHRTMPITRALRRNHRYRLRIGNASNRAQPIHLHRFDFELTRVAGTPTAGVIKDVVRIPPFHTIAVDFTATREGLTLLHSHSQLQMDYGLMALFAIVGHKQPTSPATTGMPAVPTAASTVPPG